MTQQNRNLLMIIGVLAFLMPFILVLSGLTAGPTVQTSLSAYYWTNASGAFVSMLVFFSLYLFSYTGYDKMDNIITNLAAVGMLFVAMFPCYGGSNNYLIAFIPPGVSNIIHFVSAGLTFTMLGVMSAFQFSKGSHKTKNIIYRACGYAIFSIIAAGIIITIPSIRHYTDKIRLWLILESSILWVFGFSWMTKAGFVFHKK